MTKVFLLALFSLSPDLHATDILKQVEEVDKTHQACLDSADANDSMKECNGLAYRAANELLNQFYQSIVVKLRANSDFGDPNSMSQEILRRLENSERLWLPFLAAECSLQASEMWAGSGESLVETGCLYTETVKRIRSLEALFR